MPQMAPISWLILFLIFSLTLIIFNILNFYCVIPQNLNDFKKNNTFLKSTLLWKW